MERIVYEVALLGKKCRKLLHNTFVAESNSALTAAQQVDSELVSGGPARLSYRNASSKV